MNLMSSSSGVISDTSVTSTSDVIVKKPEGESSAERKVDHTAVLQSTVLTPNDLEKAERSRRIYGTRQEWVEPRQLYNGFQRVREQPSTVTRLTGESTLMGHARRDIWGLREGAGYEVAPHNVNTHNIKDVLGGLTQGGQQKMGAIEFLERAGVEQAEYIGSGVSLEMKQSADEYEMAPSSRGVVPNTVTPGILPGFRL